MSMSTFDGSCASFRSDFSLSCHDDRRASCPSPARRSVITRWRLFRVVAVTAVAFAVLPAFADWNPGDPFKMHFPQLPDPLGWDIDITGAPHEVADDWLCTETGPVSGIHFWYSVFGDDPATQISGVTATIYQDLPANPLPYSRPGVPLWSGTFGPTQFVTRPYGSGTQGFANPQLGEPGWLPANHANFGQVNITGIADPWIQTSGSVYWLGLSVQITGTSPVGWKTSLNPFNDDATFRDPGGSWSELINPLSQQSLHMAFVIVPEPATFALVSAASAGAGVVIAVRRRKRRKEAA